jgi:hypothetical protein
MAGPDQRSPCGETDHDPKRPDNRAGLGQIAYRITNQPESLDRMLWRLPRLRVTDPESGVDLHPLAALRTRSLADPTISLIDAFAMAADVVSFYSERVANEGYIGTATQRRSVLELARTIGYELAPGVAASVHLAFTVEDADNPYRTVDVATGVQAMSIPHEKGVLPQIFETVEAITARAEWNDIRARTERPQNLVLYHNLAKHDDPLNGTLYLFDLDNSFGSEVLDDPEVQVIEDEAALAPFHPMTRRIDLPAALAERIADHAVNPEIERRLLAVPVNEVCLAKLGLNLRRGARMLAVAQAAAEGSDVTALPFRVVSATEDRAFGLTRVILTKGGEAPDAVRRAPRLRLPRLRYGVLPSAREPLGTLSVQTHVRGKTWSGDGLSALVQSQAWQRDKIMSLIRLLVLPPPELPSPGEAELGLHVMRDSAGFFGNTAPRWDTLNFGVGVPNPYPRDWDGGTGGQPNTIWVDAGGTNYITKGSLSAHVFLDREVKELQPNSWAVLENDKGDALGMRVVTVASASRADYAISGKSTGVGFLTASGEVPDLEPTSIYNAYLFRSSQIHAVSDHLPLSGLPLSSDLPQASSSVELNGLFLDLERGRPVSLSGARLDAEGLQGRETHVIREVQHIDGVTRLLLEAATAFPYDRTTLRINANVALATHGEAVVEELGSGDARLVFQTFMLRKPPLTHVSAANELGRLSSLKVRVDGVLWDEVPALGEAGPEDAVYELRRTNDGKSQIRFGDGLSGRRLPTGTLNVVAEYRSGIGLPGNVPDMAISQLKTRPLGIRSVANPSPAIGAADPETLDNARLNAPGSVKTLGRIVSLTDYEDFARGFAGVGKAQARELWSGQAKVVHLTIAPETDTMLDPGDTLVTNLRDAMERLRDPARPMILQPCARRYFALTAQVRVDSAFRLADVGLAARQKIATLFGYSARDLAQPVSAAEMIAALHAVAGVVAVDLDDLSVLLDGEGSHPLSVGLAAVLPALPARGPGQRGERTDLLPAELLAVLPSAVDLTMMEAIDA